MLTGIPCLFMRGGTSRAPFSLEALIGPPRDGSSLASRSFIPNGCPEAIGVLAPGGEFTVEIGIDPPGSTNVTRAALVRTARLLMRGGIMVPSTVLQGEVA